MSLRFPFCRLFGSAGLWCLGGFGSRSPRYPLEEAADSSAEVGCLESSFGSV